MITILLILFLLYVLATRGRTGHPLMAELRKWGYAHRGLHGDGVPENSMAAFRLALENGYGIELDIHLLADGNLAVFHDHSLKRTTGADVNIEDLTTEQLPNYHLEGTEETIPTFSQVLELFAGKAPMIVELKPTDENCDQLAEAACRMLDHYDGLFCIESFDPRCIRWLMKNRPDFVRGQLAIYSVPHKTSGVPFKVRFALSNLLTNFWNKPDFIAYRFRERNHLGVRIARKLWKVQGVSWTLTTKEAYDTALQEDWIPIFEGFKP